MSDPGAHRVERECVEGYLYSTPPLRLLLFQRSPARGGFWVPISGKVEPGDADFLAALRRELVEETGLTAPLAIRALDWHQPFDGPNGAVWRLHAYAVRVPAGWTPRLSDEHVAYRWVDPATAVAELHFSDNRRAVELLVEQERGPARSAGPLRSGPWGSGRVPRHRVGDRRPVRSGPAHRLRRSR